MFGVSRKKKAPKVLSLTTSSEEDETNALRQDQRRKKETRRPDQNKNPAKPSMLSFDPDGEIDENDHGEIDETRRRKQEKRSKREEDRRSKKSKRRGISRSMGYGGMMPTEDDASGNVIDDNRHSVEEDEEVDTVGNYDMAALEALKLGQKRREDVNKDIPTANEREEHTHHFHSNLNDVTDHPMVDQDFIPLTGSNTKQPMVSSLETFVLSGDEAMAYATLDDDGLPEEFDHGLQPTFSQPSSTVGVNGKTPTDETIDRGMEEDDRRWEDTMARRAGVLPPSSVETTATPKHMDHDIKSSPSSLSQIKSTIGDTIINLETVISDLETAQHRHESMLTSTHTELAGHQSSLEQSGNALEYYQILRQDLAAWMGALRELKTMVDATTEARIQWEGQVSLMQLQRRLEWGEDAARVLERRGLLDRTIGGRDCDGGEEEDIAEVDEFGRDVSSMAVMARGRRCEVRKRNFLRRKTLNDGVGGDDTVSALDRLGFRSSDTISSEEIQDWQQRNRALNQAVRIIPSIVKDDYRSVSNLCLLFSQWEDNHPDDFDSCYAKISLISMLSVLVMLELCERWDGLELAQHINGIAGGEIDDTQYATALSEFNWFKELTSAVVKRESEGPSNLSNVLQEVTQTCVLDRLFDYFSIDSGIDQFNNGDNMRGIYDPVSASQTKWLCSAFKDYFSSPSHDVGSRKSTMNKLATSLLSLTEHVVNKTTIPIAKLINLTVKTNGFVSKDGNELDEACADAISYSINVQAHDLCSLVTNIMGCWYPFFIESMHYDEAEVAPIVQFILINVMTCRLLPILRTFQTIALEEDCIHVRYDEFKTLIAGAYDTIKTSGVLQIDKWASSAVPFCEAVQTFGLAC